MNLFWQSTRKQNDAKKSRCEANATNRRVKDHYKASWQPCIGGTQRDTSAPLWGQSCRTIRGFEKALLASWKSETPPLWGKTVEHLGALKKHSLLFGNQRHPPPLGGKTLKQYKGLVCKVQTCLASTRQKTTLGEYT